MQSPSPHRKLSPQLLIGFTALVLILGALAVAALVGQASRRAINGPAATATPPASLREGAVITIDGQFLCLPHKNTNGPQTDECAFGLKDDNGVYYGLKDSTADYSLLSKLGTNQRVHITGTFQQQTSAIYPSAGTITVTALESSKP